MANLGTRAHRARNSLQALFLTKEINTIKNDYSHNERDA